MTSEAARAEKLLLEAGIDAENAARLARYVSLALETNRRFNLTGAKDPDALVLHVLDALSLVPYAAGPLVDVGSGAGLPGLPLAIVAGIAVTLIDATAKKAAFLASALVELGVSGEAFAGRAERLGHDPDLRERFRTATARAVASASTALELTAPFLEVGGRALLQRGAGASGEREALADATLMLGCRLEQEIELPRKGRRLLVVLKVAKTPSRFPRRTGVPAKHPLCV